jgi:hypothetical protein
VLVAPSGTYIRECDREAKIVRVEGMRGPAIPSEWDIKIESVEGLNNVPFVSLPPDILHELAKNWLPEVQVKAKPRAAEKRLQLALELWIRQNDSSTP